MQTLMRLDLEGKEKCLKVVVESTGQKWVESERAAGQGALVHECETGRPACVIVTTMFFF